MIKIVRATVRDASVLAGIGKITFIESHGKSAPDNDIDGYVAQTYTPEMLEEELQHEENLYHLVYSDDQPAGFSKIILNHPYDGCPENSIAKLERFYLLEKYYGQHIGLKLFEYLVKLVKENYQTGIWLYVWTENPRAIRFYEKCGFTINGSHRFKISETHSNPNYRMVMNV